MYPNFRNAARLRKSFINRFVPTIVIASLLLPGILALLPKSAEARGISAKTMVPTFAPAPPMAFRLPQEPGFIARLSECAAKIGPMLTSLVVELIEPEESEAVSVEESVVMFGQPAGIVDFDFDGDGKADIESVSK